MPGRKSIVGRRFTRLIVLDDSGFVQGPTQRVRTARCRCDCGKEMTTRYGSLIEGHTRSCGCYKTDKQTLHGHARQNRRTGTYGSYEAMIRRCTNPNYAGFEKYGAVGIRVCARWHKSFTNFLADMGEKPPGTSLHRIKVRPFTARRTANGLRKQSSNGIARTTA